MDINLFYSFELLEDFYRMSFMWYTAFAMIISVIVAMIISVITGRLHAPNL